MAAKVFVEGPVAFFCLKFLKAPLDGSTWQTATLAAPVEAKQPMTGGLYKLSNKTWVPKGEF